MYDTPNAAQEDMQESQQPADPDLDAQPNPTSDEPSQSEPAAASAPAPDEEEDEDQDEDQDQDEEATSLERRVVHALENIFKSYDAEHAHVAKRYQDLGAAMIQTIYGNRSQMKWPEKYDFLRFVALSYLH